MFDNPLKRNTGKPADIRDSEPRPEPIPAPRPHYSERPAATGVATIGPSILIKGELSGEEDLLIQGRVEGTINLRQNHLTIGQEGKVNANIHAHTVIIEGSHKGDIFGEEKVIIRKTGNVNGNVTAPRISLEDGAKFKGSMDMEVKRSESSPRGDTAAVFKLDKSPAMDKAPLESKGAIK